MLRLKDGFINYLTLFGSASTLICCALPSLLVSLGLGAVMAGLASNIPALIWVSEHKPFVFGMAGSMLAFNGFLLWTQRNAPCPIDLQLRDACMRGRKTSLRLYAISCAIYITGLFFAYIAPNI